MTVQTATDTALAEIFAKLNNAPPAERVVTANELIEQLRKATADAAESRRAAVRDLRLSGYTLKEIGEIVGVGPQRIHQIESGYNRHEQRSRKKAD